MSAVSTEGEKREMGVLTVEQSRKVASSRKPTEVPCPKCGSAEIARRFHAKGETLKSFTYGKRPNEFTTGLGTHTWTAQRDHIHNHCRGCQYEWATLPLNGKTKK